MTTPSDFLVRAIAKESGVRGLACITTDLVNDAQQRHRGAPTAGALLGHGLTAAALMGALLKVQQRIAVKLVGDGPLHKMVVESDAYGRVRGYVRHVTAELPGTPGQHTVREAFGDGQLVVVKDLLMAELAEGVVPLAPGSVGENLEQYLTRSEQIPSLVEIDCVVDASGRVRMAGGVLVQALPTAEAAETVAALRERIEELPPLGDLLLSGKTPHDLLAMIFAGREYTVLEERPLSFYCSCSRERSEKALVLLGREEVASLLAEGQAVVDCHFCHERYIFDRADLAFILEQFT